MKNLFSAPSKEKNKLLRKTYLRIFRLPPPSPPILELMSKQKLHSTHSHLKNFETKLVGQQPCCHWRFDSLLSNIFLSSLENEQINFLTSPSIWLFSKRCRLIDHYQLAPASPIFPPFIIFAVIVYL